MSYFSERREIRKLAKLDSAYKPESRLKKNLPTIIVLVGFSTIFFIHSILSSNYDINFKLEDIIYKMDIQEELNYSITESDLDTALQKLNDVGLTNISSRTTFTLYNLENNQQSPNDTLRLTNAEFASLLAPLYYTKFDNSITIFELYLFEESDYKIVATFGMPLNFNYKKFHINEEIYISQHYLLNNDFTVQLVDYEYLNINPKFITKTDIDEYAKNDEMGEFLTFVFTQKENRRTFVELLNYTTFSVENDTIILQ